MPVPHTNQHTYLLDTGLELSLKPTRYQLALIIKRPKKLKQTTLEYDRNFHPCVEPIRDGEMMFVEDLIYNFLSNPTNTIDETQHTIKQLKLLIGKMENHVERRLMALEEN